MRKADTWTPSYLLLLHFCHFCHFCQLFDLNQVLSVHILMKTMIISFKLEAIGKIMAIRAAIYKMSKIAMLLIKLKVNSTSFLLRLGKFYNLTDFNILQYWLWSFQGRDTKLERFFLLKINYSQMKLLNFEN